MPHTWCIVGSVSSQETRYAVTTQRGRAALWGMDGNKSSRLQQELDRSTATCLRCGRSFQRKRTGRPPIWCSAFCRRLAYEERRAAERGAVGWKIVTERIEPSLNGCVERVIASPTATKRVLQAVRTMLEEEAMPAYGPWAGASRVVAELVSDYLHRDADRRRRAAAEHQAATAAAKARIFGQ